MEMKCTKSLGNLSGKAMAVSACLLEPQFLFPLMRSEQKVGWNSSHQVTSHRKAGTL